MISKDTHSTISLPESADGRTHSASPCGQTIDLFGQVAPHASRSARQDSKKAKQTLDTFSPSGSTSSASDALQASLESRLQAQLPTGGLTMFIAGWKRKITPLGRPFCQLAVSARPISATDCGLWATPRALSFNESHQPGMNGAMASWMSLWPTPRSADGDKGERTPEGYRKNRERYGTGVDLPTSVAMWQTPVADDSVLREKGKFNSRGEPKLSGQAAMWATPTTRDHKDGQFTPNVPVNSLLGRQVWDGSPAPMEKRGSLNPAFPCWLMGFPIEWESCADMVTPLSRRSPRSSSKQQCK